MFGNYEKPPAKKIKMKQQLLSFSYKPTGTATAVLGRFTVLGPCVICTILLLHSVADLGEMRRMRPHPPWAAQRYSEKRQISSYCKQVRHDCITVLFCTRFNSFPPKEKE